MDPVIDRVNLVPDFLSGICLIAFFIVLGDRYRHTCRFGAAIAVLYTVISLGTHIFSLSFFSRFDILDLYAKDPDATQMYGQYLDATCIELIVSALLSLAIFILLLRLVPHVAGSIGEENSIQTRRLRRSMRLEALLFILIRSLSSFAWIVYLYYSQFSKAIELDPGFMGGAISSTVPLIDGLWIVPPLVSIVELFVALHLTSRFRTESELTYAEL